MNDRLRVEQPKKRARRISPSLTLRNAVDIWRCYWVGEAQHVIAASLGVNQGRISEVLSGKRFPEARAIASKSAA